MNEIFTRTTAWDGHETATGVCGSVHRRISILKRSSSRERMTEHLEIED